MSVDRVVGSIFHAESDAGADDPRVVAAVQEYLHALETGEPPSKDEFAAQHPEIAERLQDCLAGLEFVHQAALNVRQQTTGLPAETPEGASKLPLGDFRIIREIGRGGMGVVYEAIQLSLGRRVALKVLPFAAALDAKYLQRFKNEAQAAAQLHHTNIVPVYAVGTQRGVHFYAMQLIDGHPLSTLIAQLRQLAGKSTSILSGGTSAKLASRIATGSFAPPSSASEANNASTEPHLPLPASSAARHDTLYATSTVLTATHLNRPEYFRTVAAIVQQAAAALEHAHQFGVIHRDIKPANLLLDERGHIWITDFGLAQIQSDGQLTRTGDLLGTLRYMSPEQATGNHAGLDHRTDIYSLGVTLYELLTLEPMFAGTNRQIALRRILEDDPPPPRSIDPKIPIELETIVLKAIAKEPSERYPTAGRLADDLNRWLTDQPILARRPTLFERAARWRRQHRTLVRSALLVTLLGVLGLLATTIVVTHEHIKTKDAYKREIAQRAAAETSFQHAWQAVDAFSQLGEEELANRPEMRQFRRKLLQTALAYYQDFLNQRRDDPTVQDKLASTADRIQRIVDELTVLEGVAPLTLLAYDRVQQELSLTPAQRKSIDELLAHLTVERDKARSAVKQTDRQPEQQYVEMLRDHEEKIEAALSKQQLQRLQQIAWQQRGPFAFKYPEVAAKLDLSPEQRQQIANIIEEERPKGPGGPGGPPREDRGPKGPPSRPFVAADDMLDESSGKGDTSDQSSGPAHEPPFGTPDHRRTTFQRTIDRILKVLSPEQLAKWEALLGEPFDAHLDWHPDDLWLR